MNPQNIRSLKYSPFFVSEILHSFLDGAKRIDERGAKFELIYLVIPFIMDDDFRKKLSSSNVNSTFKTAFLNNNRLKEKLFFVNNKVNHSKSITNDGLIYLNSFSKINIGEYIRTENEYKKIDHLNEYKREFLKASYNLGVIFAKEGYINVFLKSKVTNI